VTITARLLVGAINKKEQVISGGKTGGFRGAKLGSMGTVSARYSRSIYNSCVELGCPEPALQAVFQNAPECFNDPTARYDQSLLIDMLHAAEKATGNSAIGLQAGSQFRPSTFLDIGYGLIACQNLREALAFNYQYQRLTQEIGRTSVVVDGEIARIKWRTQIKDFDYVRPATEAAFAGYAVLGRWLTWDSKAKVRAMYFRHGEVAHAQLCESLFQCPVYFNAAQDVMELDAETLLRPMPQANATLLAHLRVRLDRALAEFEGGLGVQARVRDIIQQLLSDGGNDGAAPDLVNVAAILNMSERTLRRRLADEGGTFRQVLTEARQEACEIYLKERRWSVAELAQMLGYSEHSAFSRAFKKWFGMPPSQYVA
jgi:AraC-like DNA-binding protein